jgi:hypothetical protein
MFVARAHRNLYRFASALSLLATPLCGYSQVVLEADGPGNTYELISSIFAPGNDAVENPECVHPEFGRHIAEVWDSDLNRYVFEFYSHVTPDNDRCINFDRQRIEIKTYEPSPAYLKGVTGETIVYKWKFKLPVGFQPSSSFTHIHQIKAVGGNDGDPLFTLTPRKGSPNKLELIHDNTTKVKIVNLSLFEGVWVECTEVVYVDSIYGTYSMTIKKVSDSTTLLSYSNNKIMTIRSDNTFIRPKWGIYRSLNTPSELRDEAMRFAGFSIQEGTTGVGPSESTIPPNFALEQNYPNPFNPSTIISYQIPTLSRAQLTILDCLGREVDNLVERTQTGGRYQVEWNGARFPSGVYFCRLSVVPSARRDLVPTEVRNGHTKGYMETRKILLLK